MSELFKFMPIIFIFIISIVVRSANSKKSSRQNQQRQNQQRQQYKPAPIQRPTQNQKPEKPFIQRDPDQYDIEFYNAKAKGEIIDPWDIKDEKPPWEL